MNTQPTNYYTYNRTFTGLEFKNCELKQNKELRNKALEFTPTFETLPFLFFYLCYL
ncbi:MAG: hypothetical protein WBJ09_04650 [Candidatus Cloacimonas acidaminovorans]